MMLADRERMPALHTTPDTGTCALHLWVVQEPKTWTEHSRGASDKAVHCPLPHAPEHRSLQQYDSCMCTCVCFYVIRMTATLQVPLACELSASNSTTVVAAI